MKAQDWKHQNVFGGIQFFKAFIQKQFFPLNPLWPEQDDYKFGDKSAEKNFGPHNTRIIQLN